LIILLLSSYNLYLNRQENHNLIWMSNSSNKAIEPLVQHDFLSQVSYNLNVFEKNLFYMIFSQVGKDDPAFKVYHISIPMIEQLTGGHLHSEQVYESACRLLQRIFEVKDGKNRLSVSVISSAKYMDGTSTIAVRIDPEMMSCLFEFKKKLIVEQLTGRQLRSEEVYEGACGLLQRSFEVKEGKNRLSVGIISSLKYIDGTSELNFRIDPEAEPYLPEVAKEYGVYT
jgi:hypothetical protein